MARVHLSASVVVNREAFRARTALRRALQSLPSGGPLGKELVKQVGDFDAKQNEQTFASQGAKSGKRWAPLSPAYAAYKSGKRSLINELNRANRQFPSNLRPKKTPGVGAKILVWSGSMRDSLRHPGNPAHIARLNGDVLELGTRHHLAQYHQEGTPKMPARPPVRKAAVQVYMLKRAIARVLLLGLGKEAGGPLGSYLRALAATVQANPRT